MVWSDNYLTNEGTALTLAAPGVLGNDTDVDSPTITAVLVAGPTHRTLTLTADGGFTYTPAANYNGPDSFTHKANHGSPHPNVATMLITVPAGERAPLAREQARHAPEGTAD